MRRKRSGRDEYDAALLDELTSQPGELATFAQAFAGMAAEMRAKQHRREEMQAAAQIQQSILPPPLPREGAAARIDLHAEMHPAREIGGDFYDYFLIDPHRLAITVADVSGKGIPAVAVHGRVAHRHAQHHRRPRHGLRHVGGQPPAGDAEHRLHVRDDVSRRARPGERRAALLQRRPQPALSAAREGRPATRSAATGIPFGIDADMPYRIAETVLLPGDTLFLFSDGITEAFDAAGPGIRHRPARSGAGSRRAAAVPPNWSRGCSARPRPSPPAPSSPTTSPAWRWSSGRPTD